MYPANKTYQQYLPNDYENLTNVTINLHVWIVYEV